MQWYPSHSHITKLSPPVRAMSADALLPVPAEERAFVDVHDMDGRLLRRHVPRGKALQGLPRGMYVVDGKKVAK